MKFALLIFYAAGTLAAPVLDDRYPKAEVKEIECTSSRFRPGTTFEYQYGGETINSVEGSTTQSTGLQLSARVLITQLDGCKYHMRLADSKLSTKSMNEEAFKESVESTTLQSALETNDLIFSMNGNTITALHPRASETTEALNIKRGILSTLQLDETKTSEIDVNGACGYTITKQDGQIIKSKTLSDCGERAQNEIGIQAASIKTGADLKPLNSMSTCTYSMDADTIRSINCEEKHLFRPFSAGYKTTSGAMTVVKQTLAFSGYNANNVNEKFDSRTYNLEKSLAFEHSIEAKQTETLTDQVEAVIKRLIDQSNLSAKKTSAHEFTTLVTLFRKMSRSKMVAVWDKYFDCVASKVCESNDLNLKDLYRQYMLDAIAYCGTPSCIAVVKDVTISGEVAGERANMFLQSIALVAKTTNSMIRDILEIAERKPTRQVFLTLGTLISRHCSKSPAECEVQSGTAVIQALNFLERTLGDCAGQEDHERVEQILITLKAIGNAKRPTNARDAIIRCARSSIHSNITVSAFDALRGMPCDAGTLNVLRGVVADENLDADKRIYAFQAAMRCPTKESLELLVHQFNLEKNNQLASFMWTTFTNILESGNPDNKEAKTLLAGIVKETPLKNADLPMYQYSKNYEKSIYLDSLKTGATAQGNLVFHPDGFLPKTAMFEMTAKVMGVPVDLVETVVGIDGVETILENAFGPDGVMPKELNFKMFNWTFSTEKLREMVETRVRREIKPKKSDDTPAINVLHDEINKKQTKPSGFMSLKVMGQEVRIMSYDDIYALIEQIDNMNVIQLLLNWAKGGQKTFSKSLMFLEMTHTVPTGLGLPLKLKLTGSTVGTVDLSGKFDIRSLFWGPAGLNINGFVKPTAVVDISGKMGIESTLVSTGLLVSNNMVVSNMLKGSINYKEGEILKINLDTPSEPVQLFHASSTPFMFLNEKTQMINGVPRVIKTDKCLKSQLIGYGLCTSIRVPVAFRNYEAPYFPLSGPAHVGLSLVRGDDRLTTFQFLTTLTKVGNGVEGAIEFSAPGAVYERKLNAKMLYTDENNDKVLTLTSERVGSLKMSYNSISHTTSLEARANLFKKDLITRLEYFNRTNAESKQFGIQATAEYGDIYRFQHVTKYVTSAAGPALETMTEYAPNKVISTALKYDSTEQKVKATVNMNQFRQSFEASGKWENTAESKGLTLALIHLTSGKSVSLYTGYVTGEGKQEVVMNANILGRPIKNILGLYKDGGKKTVRNFFLFQRNTATVEATYEDRDGMKEVQMNADIFGRRGMANVLFSNQGTEQIFRITADAAGKRMSSTAVVTNMEVEKSIRISLDSSGRIGEITVGYYNMRDVTIFKVGGEVLGKKAELFWKLRKSGGFQSTVGGVFDKNVFGLKQMYGNSDPRQKSLCTSMYYGTTEAEKVAVESCIKYNDYDSVNRTHRQMEYSVDLPVWNKKIAMLQDIISETGRMNMATRAMYNDQVLGTSRMNLILNDLSNSAIEFDLESGKYRGGWKAYSQKTEGTTDFGLLMRVMDKTLEFLTRYTEVKSEGETQSKITSSILLNGRTLPVTTDVDVINRNAETIMSAALNVGRYSMKQSTGVLYGNGKYGLGCAFEVLKDGVRLTKIFTDYIATVSESKYELGQAFGFAIKSKEYKYGWNIEYETQTFGIKRTHVLRANLQYATDRKSGITVMFANSEKTVSLEVDVEYVPTKKVSHTARFDKEQRQLDVSIEFLPKMFARLMTRLDNNLGYELVTSTNLEWGTFRKALKVVMSYINNDKMFKISTSIAGDVSIGMKLNKITPTSLTFTVTGFGNTAELTVVYQNMQLTLDVVVNGRRLVNVEGNYDQVTKSIRMFARSGEKVFFDITTGYNKVLNAFNMAVAGTNKWAGVLVTNKGEKTIVSFTLFNKGIGKVTLDREDKSLGIQLKSTASFLFKYQPTANTVSITMKTSSNRITITTKADWIGKEASTYLTINKERFGIKFLLSKNSLIVKLTASPLMTMKAILSYVDNGIKMEIQRITKDKIISEVSMKYALTNEACEMLFNWNTETIANITEKIRPLIKTALVEGKALISAAMTQSGKIIALSKDAKAEIVNFMKRLEKAFDEFDFVAARDEVGEMTLKAVKKLSTVTVDALNALATTLDNINARTPEVVQKLRGLIKDLKNINIEGKAKEMVTKAKALIKKGREMIMKGQQLITDMKLDENVREIVDVVMKITANLTEATRPVVEKALTLLKDFKIRGMRVEDIINMARTEGIKNINKIMGDLKLTATTKFNELKAKIITACDKATKYLMEMNVPYTDRTVAQVIEIIKQKIADLKKTIETMDAEALIKEMKSKVMGYEINGKPVAQYINDLQAQVSQIQTFVVSFVERYQVAMKDLPEATRRTLHLIVRSTRDFVKDMDVYITTINNYITQVNTFAEPLVTHLNFVKSSVIKHFGPIAKTAVARVTRAINEVKLPAVTPIIYAEMQKITDFILPLVRPIVPLYRNILEQLRALNVMGLRVGTVFDMQVEMIDNKLNEMVTDAKTKMNRQMNVLNNMVEQLKRSTPEQIIDNSIDSSVRICKELVTFMNTMYEQREMMTKNAIKEVMRTYNKMKSQYQRMTARSFDEVTDDVIRVSSDGIMITAAELSNLIKQVVAMDISTPTWKAWTDADVIGHLERYGVNEKIRMAIRYAKDTKLTDMIIRTIASIQGFIDASIQKSSIKALELYRQLDVVIKYLKSIPKKDYDTWLNELTQFALSKRAAMENTFVKIYEMSRLQAMKAYETLEEMAKADASKLYKEYADVAKEWYNILADKAQLVYDEVNPESVKVYNHYKTIITDFLEKQYMVIKKILTAEYEKIYADVKGRIGELRMKMEEKVKSSINTMKLKYAEILAKIEKIYGELLTKYGDLTWEDVAMKVEKYTVAQFADIKQKIVMQYEKIFKQAVAIREEIEAKAMKMYNKVVLEFERIIEIVKAKLNTMKSMVETRIGEIKPQLMAVYKKYETMIRARTEEMILKAKTMYVDIKAKATEVYNLNKDKTLRQLYNEIRKFIMDNYLKQKEYLKALSEKNLEKATQLLNEAKTKAMDMYSKVGLKMNTIIIPELLAEAESIINQTLRNTVIMSKEIMRAYTPHAILVRDISKRYIEIIKVRAPALLAKAKGLITMDMAQVQEMFEMTITKIEMKLKELIETIKKNEKYTKYVTILEDKFAKLKGIVKAKVTELSTNPSLLRIKADIEAKIVELKKLIIEKVEELMTNPNVVIAKQKIQATMKVLRERIDEYQAKLDVYVKQVVELLKQMQMSGKFTAGKLQENLKPYMDNAEMKLKTTLADIPAVVSRSLQYFADRPEEAFWNGVAVYKEAVVGALEYAKTMKKEEVINRFLEIYEQAATFGKDLYTKSTDEWTKATVAKLSTDIVALYDKLSKQYEALLIEGKNLPALVRAFYEKNLAILKSDLATLKKWSEEQIEELKVYWDNSPLKDVFVNPIWGELASEVTNHELVGLAKEIKDAIVAKVAELKVTITPMLKEKFAEVKAAVEKNLARINTEVIEMYNNAMEKITLLINKGEKIFDEITLADVVAFVEKQYNEAIVKLGELKVKIDELKVKLINKAKECYTVCKTKVNAVIEEYKTKLMPYYTKIMETYQMYYKEISMKSKELIEEVIVKYNSIKKEVVAKYKDIAAKAVEYVTKYKTMTIDEMKKIRDTLTKTWEESEIRAKLEELKKMTIRETIEALKKLPAAVYMQVVSNYNKIVAELERIYKEYAGMVEEQLEKILKMLQPYLTNVQAAYGWLENEIMQTAKFVNDYYGLEELYINLKKSGIAEFERIISAAKEKLPMIPMILKKYANVYKQTLITSATGYVETYKKLVQGYAKQAEDLARETGDKTLRGIHTGLKMIDSVDMTAIKAKIMDSINKISEFIMITRKDGEIKISIRHPNLKSLLMYYTNLIKESAKKTMDTMNMKVKEMLKIVKSEIDNLAKKAGVVGMKIQEAVMRYTAELRRDFNISFKVNKKIFNKIYEAVKAVIMKNYEETKAYLELTASQITGIINHVKTIANNYYKELIINAQKVMTKIEAVVMDIANAKTPKEMYEKATMYVMKSYNVIKAEITALIEKYQPMVGPQMEKFKVAFKTYLSKLEEMYKKLTADNLKAYLATLKEKSAIIMAKVDEKVKALTKTVMATAEIYVDAIKRAYKELKAGIPVEEVFRPLVKKIKSIYSTIKGLVEKQDIRGKLCAKNLELCKLVDESIAAHKMLAMKYINKMKSALSTGKAQVDRTVRKMNKEVKERNIGEKYIATAMIMGDYMLTFDNKLYNFVDFVKARNEGVSPCRYLLTRDFQDSKFTIVKSDGAITVETPDMAIKIRDDGRTKTTIGNEVSTSLPAEAGQSQCVRVDNLILCHFRDQRLKVTVDLKNSFTIISLSGWYKGKTRGLLGTYNNEAHDDWRLPDNTITKNINEFVNKYELTGDAKCQLDLKTDHATTCVKPMSKKCEKFFMSADSPFAKYFSAVSPKPFMELCKQSTKCTTKRAPGKAACSVIASYVTMMRTKGIWVSHPNECMGDRGRDVNEEWAQKPMKKVIDVVVMVSQKENMHKLRKRIATTMYQLHRTLKEAKFQVRYALIGFGGLGVHEAAHTHPLRRGQTVFGYAMDLTREIKAMPYTGKSEDTNDGYHAILMGSRLKFRPGAEKIFLMFNSEPHASHESGPSIDETQFILANEANAPLIVFDTVNFPNFGKESGRVLGETERKLYTTKNIEGIADRNLVLPASEFKNLILLSKGGLFTNTALKKPKQAAISLSNVIQNWIQKDIQVCKRCVLRNSWTGQSRAICVPDPTAQC